MKKYLYAKPARIFTKEFKSQKFILIIIIKVIRYPIS